MSLKQQHVEKEMEAPFIVEYEDKFWLHHLCCANSDPPLSGFYRLVEVKGINREFEAGIQCIVKQNSE